MDSGNLGYTQSICEHSFVNTNYKYHEGPQRQFIMVCKKCAAIRRYSTINDVVELDDYFNIGDESYTWFMERFGIKALAKLES